jgi:hypothetical protein
MTAHTARRLAAVIEGLSKLHPEWRVGQLVANVAAWAKGPTSEAIWDVTDEEFLEAAEAYVSRKQPVNPPSARTQAM